MKNTKKKKIKKESDTLDLSANMAALEELTSSDIVQQVKAGLSRIAPLESESESEEPSA